MSLSWLARNCSSRTDGVSAAWRSSRTTRIPRSRAALRRNVVVESNSWKRADLGAAVGESEAGNDGAQLRAASGRRRRRRTRGARGSSSGLSARSSARSAWTHGQ